MISLFRFFADRNVHSVGLSRFLTVALCMFPLPLFAQLANTASLRIADESAPAGGIAQIKLELTEPRPIIIVKSTVRSTRSTAQLRQFSIPYRSATGDILGAIRGARAFSASGNLLGTATLVGAEVKLQILSPDGQLGLVADTPLVVLSADVAGTAASGATTPLSVDLGTLSVEMPGGDSYFTEFKTGTFTVGGVSIDSISPAGDFVPRNTQLVIRGTGFQAGGELDINEVSTTPTEFVNSTEIHVVAQQDFSLHGRRLRWRNPNNVRDEFFAVAPAPRSLPGTHPLIANTIPLFGTNSLAAARVDFGGAAGVQGIALENFTSSEIAATIRGFRGTVPTSFQATVSIPAGGTRTEDLSTLFGTANHGANGVVVEAPQPIRVMGLQADTAQSLVDPIPAEAATPVLVSLAAAVDGASFLAGGVAPGEIVSLFGGPFLSPSDFARNLPLPGQIGGVSVTMNGIPAPLFFVGEEQINCLAPFGLTGTEVLIQVLVNGEVKASLGVPRRSSSPGIFTFDFSGTGAGVIAENASGRVVTPAAPLKTGDFAVIYCSGLGAVTNSPLAGDGAALAPLAETLSRPTVTIGGITVPTLFSGLTPRFAGLYQINVPISADLPRGSALPVQITINGQASNIVTTAVE